jgi:hypothetical protein
MSLLWTDRRTIEGLGAGWILSGGLLFACPIKIAQFCAGRGAVSPSAIVRALGARLVVQGACTLRQPTSAVLRTAATLDGAHALSMLILVRTRPQYRRNAAVSGIMSTLSAVVATVLARRICR